MSTMSIGSVSIGSVPLVDHSAPQPSGATTEIVTVSALLSMPAVWTSLVDRTLPIDVLLERFMIVLLTCALLAELIRRLGEGGALSHALAETAEATKPARATAPTATVVDADETVTLDAPLALDAPVADDDLGALSDFDDLADLAPLDLDVDPFADPA